MSTTKAEKTSWPSRLRAFLSRLSARVEDGLTILMLASMVTLAALNAGARVISGLEVPGAGVYIQQLNLLIAFFGAVVATREGRHLTLSTGHTVASGRFGRWAQRLGNGVAGAISVLFALASWEFVQEMRTGSIILPGEIPAWWFQCIMFVGFGLMALRFFFRDIPLWKGTLLALVALAVVYAVSLTPVDARGTLLWPAIVLLILSGLLGTPMFALMGAVAMLLFFKDEVTIAAVPEGTYAIATSPNLHVIPLFAFAGYLLARGGASKRLVRFFTAFFGWLPGGIAVVVALVCAFFTTFTGASGVTILGLGGVLLPLLLEAGYPAAFSIGLLTTAGSLGMLFPPSLPVILYGVKAGISVMDMFIAGIVPGLLIMAAVIGYGVYVGVTRKVPRPAFSAAEAKSALWQARYELLLPVLLLSGYFGGFLNLGEAAALTALYILVVECILTRGLSLRNEVPKVALECATVVGALLIIFGTALGLTNYLVDAEIPNQLTAWVQETVHYRWLFVLALNVVLLVVGSLMEGFSAIVILVPLITPIGEAFGFHPIHLGILFLANLEAGFLLPPVGLNLFLSSMRFERPLVSLYRPILPFLLLLFAVVLLISYLPSLSLLWL